MGVLFLSDAASDGNAVKYGPGRQLHYGTLDSPFHVDRLSRNAVGLIIYID